MSTVATTFGAFLVGLVARVVGITATQVVGAGARLTFSFAGKASRLNPRHHGPKDVDHWTRELRMRVSAALDVLEIPGEFSIAFDEVPPNGSRLDLAVVAACMGAVGMLGPDTLGRSLFLGELDMKGRLRPACGVLPILRTANLDKAWFQPGNELADWRFVVPKSNAAEASRAGAPFVFAIESVADLANDTGFPFGLTALPEPPPWKPAPTDVAFLNGPRLGPRVLRAMEIAAAGGHGVAFIGSPRDCFDAAQVLWSLLPPLVESEAVEITEIHSACGVNGPRETHDGLVSGRPFRSPNYTCAAPNASAGRGIETIVGGGEDMRPGELSLARHGMLFLNDSPDFRIEVMRRINKALGSGESEVVRGDVRVKFPTRPEIFAIGIPACFCTASCCIGYRVDHAVSCTLEKIDAYYTRAFARIGRRVDIVIRLDSQANVEPTSVAHAKQLHAEIVARVVAAEAFDARHRSLDLSADACERVARTIANLVGRASICADDRNEAFELTKGIAP